MQKRIDFLCQAKLLSVIIEKFRFYSGYGGGVGGGGVGGGGVGGGSGGGRGAGGSALLVRVM